jgi:hypothetical protein
MNYRIFKPKHICLTRCYRRKFTKRFKLKLRWCNHRGHWCCRAQSTNPCVLEKEYYGSVRGSTNSVEELQVVADTYYAIWMGSPSFAAEAFPVPRIQWHLPLWQEVEANQSDGSQAITARYLVPLREVTAVRSKQPGSRPIQRATD